MLAGSESQVFFALLVHLSGKLLVRGGVVCCIETRSALERVCDARADIFCAYVALEFGLSHEFGGLLTSAAE
jgi:hypothetical protein